MSLRFTWDRRKAAVNLRKHDGISFDEAATVFMDVNALIFDDEAHSMDEPREIIIGYSAHQRLLLVSFIEREETVRIISARKATPTERKDYEQNTNL